MNRSEFNYLKALSRSISFQHTLCVLKKITTIINGREMALAAIVAAFSAVAIAAVLTPGAGILSAPVFARASFADPTDIKFKVKDGSEEVIHVPEAAETVIQQIVI